MASSFGLADEITLDEIAAEAGVPGTLSGSEPNLLRAWAKCLGGATCPSDIAGIPDKIYERSLDSFDPYSGDEPVPGGPPDKKLTPVDLGRLVTFKALCLKVLNRAQYTPKRPHGALGSESGPAADADQYGLLV